MSDYATLFGAGKPTKLWVSGKTYKTEEFVISPTNSHPYMRKTNGAGATDPCNDKTNWRLIGPGGIKSIQRGSAALTGNPLSISVGAVDVNNSILTFLGFTFQTGGSVTAGAFPRLALTSATTITVTTTTGLPSSTVSWELIEHWS